MPGVSFSWIFRALGAIYGSWGFYRFNRVGLAFCLYYEKMISGKRGCLAFGHDHVGHGTSEGKRVSIENVDHYVDDVIHHCMDMQDKHPNLPSFIVGHSMGGMIAVRSVLKHPGFFKGMVLIGPLIVPGPQV